MVELCAERRSDQLALVVPCFNEAARLDVQAFLEFLKNHSRVTTYFIDDGSQDTTHEVLQQIRATNPEQVRLLKLSQNCGKAEAVRRGFLAAADAGPQYVGFWDADLATPLSATQAMLTLLDERPEIRGVFGSRVQLLGHRIQRKLFRHYLGRLFATVASIVLKLPVYDTQCGAKIFRASHEFYSCLDRPFISRWIFDVELIARLICQGKPQSQQPIFYELPLQTWHDVADSKIRPRDFFRAVIELWKIHREYHQRLSAANK